MTLPVLQELAVALRKIVRADFVISDSETARPYECDGLPMYCQEPALVVLPETVDELRQVMALCRSRSVPIVTRGAGTGLSAGATPIESGVVVSLARMDQILEINPQARKARVQPGVRNISISQAAKAFGLYYAPDPSSQIACSIGGNVAENSGGVHCLKYGLTVHNVIQLKVLTAQGDEITLGSGGLDSYGFDLLALLTGSEGLLGIVTEITVRLLPEPENVQLIMAAFDDVTLAADTVSAIIAEGIIPAGLEMMDSCAIQAAEDFCQAGYFVSLMAAIPRYCRTANPLSIFLKNTAQRTCTSRNARRNACYCGRAANPPFRQWGACRPTTTAWMAPFHEVSWRRC